MPILLGALAARFLQTAAAAAGATAALLTVAALADGGWPAPDRLLGVALPTGAYVGAAWTLAAWRGEGGDVALAALGRPPAWSLLPLAALGAAVLLAAPSASSAAAVGPRLSVQADRLRVEAPGGLELRWDAAGAVRSDTGERHAALPRPTPLPDEPAPTPRPWPAVARIALLLSLLGGLARASSAPGLPLTVGAAGLAAALGHWAGRLA
jgi:hypothetical protein